MFDSHKSQTVDMCIVHMSKVVYMCIVTYKNESGTFSTGELIKLDMCIAHMSIGFYIICV